MIHNHRNEDWKIPYLGVAYYPEAWDKNELDSDISKMGQFGIKVVRIGEFAWQRMEAKPGSFDFSFFKDVIKRLSDAGIKVILGTPTATPPIWLTTLDPKMLMEQESGRRTQHGGRRHCCSNNPIYYAYSMRIVEQMAKEFSEETSIIGWQIDNEIYSWGMGCFCMSCTARFREMLEERYDSIDHLNKAWNLNLFSQCYDTFEQIPAPRDAWHNPHLKLAWKEFQAQSHIKFVQAQAEILHRWVRVPVGTDMMPFGGVDHQRMNMTLDVAQFNHYNDENNLWQSCFWYGLMRRLKDRPFWNMETATCWNGSTQIEQALKQEGFCEANSWLPIAHGAEMNLYWLWRTHWAGHEIMHGAILDACGRPMHIVGEVENVARGYQKAADFISKTRVETLCAIHYSSYCRNMQRMQPILPNLEYTDTIQNCVYQPMVSIGLCPDVISSEHSLDSYRLIISPMLMTLEENDLSRRVENWVRQGGTWIVGPLTDIRNIEGTKYQDRPFGMLEELAAVRWKYSVPDSNGLLSCVWLDDTCFEGGSWYDLFEADDSAEVTVSQGHSAIQGSAVVLRRSVGKGRIFILGTLPSTKDFQRLLSEACAYAEIPIPKVSGLLSIVPRVGDTENGFFAVEMAGKEATIVLDHAMNELLSEQTMQGEVSLKPYQTIILRAI